MVGPIIATCVFAWIVFLLSFILFVAGCSDTYLRNRRPPPPVVYVAVPPLPYGQYPTQPIYAAAPMVGQEKQPFYAAAPMAGNVNQPMMQAAPSAPMQYPQPAPPGGVVEYYGTAR
ncbi:hypothetical protein NQ176_g9614 [Zarea fungicola]|uniref:Uncharacterized protein n=1 Tax=Zarea fungicola TaxID=93591 RepID=A0ACC1MKJ4_9HYPO|nr:hypothetical protein NQ176_g9614 [Lecanicillium fungicola]